MNTTPAFSPALRRQRGVVLFISLIILVAMSLAGIALMRGVDTNVTIAGNLAFKQGATAAGDLGVETARTWLLANSGGSALYNDNAGSAYYATFQSNVDLLGTDPARTDFNWSTGVLVGPDAAGNSMRYVIHRLCDAAGDPAGVNCLKAAGSSSSTSGTRGAASFGAFAISVPASTYYRITVRVTGPRNTTSYVQAVVY